MVYYLSAFAVIGLLLLPFIIACLLMCGIVAWVLTVIAGRMGRRKSDE